MRGLRHGGQTSTELGAVPMVTLTHRRQALLAAATVESQNLLEGATKLGGKNVVDNWVAGAVDINEETAKPQ